MSRLNAFRDNRKESHQSSGKVLKPPYEVWSDLNRETETNSEHNNRRTIDSQLYIDTVLQSETSEDEKSNDLNSP
jgi:hypothetical protein